jgi:hypothetical protein
VPVLDGAHPDALACLLELCLVDFVTCHFVHGSRPSRVSFPVGRGTTSPSVGISGVHDCG